LVCKLCVVGGNVCKEIGASGNKKKLDGSDAESDDSVVWVLW
jgi:hypothetical protein